jgi:hypothetical protein
VNEGQLSRRLKVLLLLHTQSELALLVTVVGATVPLGLSNGLDEFFSFSMASVLSAWAAARSSSLRSNRAFASCSMFLNNLCNHLLGGEEDTSPD